MHIYNNKRLIINFKENLIKVRVSTSNGILLGRKKVIGLALQDRIEKLVLTSTNVFYLFFNPSNLMSLGILNNMGIFYYNEN